MLPGVHRSHDEFFWRQAARWLARPAPRSSAVNVPDGAEPGDVVPVHIDVRDAALSDRGRDGRGDADDAGWVRWVWGEDQTLNAPDTPTARRTVHDGVRSISRGLYRVRAEARRGAVVVARRTDGSTPAAATASSPIHG